ncbi:hypothetical protein L6164_012317 [Bauhinia variegata]|uniref:Uncharacterized protein n=1 Tax=Bauhinia variegata TaxID=167791 RepID=A0ACB9PAX2_BAUVA|nr:hypothetical protein L6164_012317 [Bauhinia variegata]
MTPPTTPLIKCTSSFNNATTCRITALKVYALDESSPKLLDWFSTSCNRKPLSHAIHGHWLQSLIRGTSKGYLTLSHAIHVVSRNMKSLTILELRNDNISGPIPSYIGEFSSLTGLDLSFNSITGEIPGSLFTLSQLLYMSLGNNKVNGTLPTQKSASLVFIDLSYNNLSGSFPSWVNEQGLQLL